MKSILPSTPQTPPKTMALSQPHIEQLKRELSAKYQTDVDRELLPLLAELLETRQAMELHTQLLKQALNDCLTCVTSTQPSVSVQSSSPTIRFTTCWQAFCHGLGKGGIGLTVFSLSGLLAFFLWFYRTEQRQEAERISIHIEQDRKLLSFSTFSAQASLKTIRQGKYQIRMMELYPVKDVEKAIVGQSFLYEPACRCIQVPIYIQSEAKTR